MVRCQLQCQTAKFDDGSARACADGGLTVEASTPRPERRKLRENPAFSGQANSNGPCLFRFCPSNRSASGPNSLPLTPPSHENILRTCGRLRKTHTGSKCGIAKAANSSRHSAVRPIMPSLWQRGMLPHSNSPRATWFAITSASSRIAPPFREIRSFDRPR